ncbi:MAG TPA: hypothetical protein EYG02_01340 [Henriciella marina]|uniref:hypothetical protein n=1 Tax=Henriciella sp. TaxID=1968823 RepID=UPI00181F4F16|nr:hypothetical protein [Henriciella sp.]HIG23862.1 hypothetical protein [Henriciella sp.]HIK63657.1 hypothetical protein [Henriciella marina]
MEWELPTFVFFAFEQKQSSWLTQFFISIIGVLLGGGITFFVTLFFSARKEKREAERETTALRQKLFLLYFDIIDTFNDVFALKNSYREIFLGKKRPINPAQIMDPLMGGEKPAKFVSGETFFGLGEFLSSELINQIAELYRLRNSILSNVQSFSSRKQDLHKMMLAAGAKRTRAQTIEGEFNTKDHSEIIVEMELLSEFAKKIVEQIDDFHEHSVQIAKTWNSCVQSSKDPNIQNKKLDLENEKAEALR